MDLLAESLSMFVLDRNVINRTGIAGSFIVRLEYKPDGNMQCFGPAAACTIDPNSTIAPAATIFNALEQQLGLTLEPIKAPHEHIVIDLAEPPLENQRNQFDCLALPSTLLINAVQFSVSGRRRSLTVR